MIKKICVIFLIILTTSCSNLDMKEGVSENELQSKLEYTLQVVKSEIKENDLTQLEKILDIPLRRKFILSELERYDLSKMNFYYTKPEINKKRARNIVAIKIEDNIVYYDVDYSYEKDSWRIKKFEERR